MVCWRRNRASGLVKGNLGRNCLDWTNGREGKLIASDENKRNATRIRESAPKWKEGKRELEQKWVISLWVFRQKIKNEKYTHQVYLISQKIKNTRSIYKPRMSIQTLKSTLEP